MTVITITRPDGSTYSADSNQSVVAPGVDADGVYLGLVALTDGVTQVPGPPPTADWRWSFAAGQWTSP
jgi:hypothetical protein